MYRQHPTLPFLACIGSLSFVNGHTTTRCGRADRRCRRCCRRRKEPSRPRYRYRSPWAGDMLAPNGFCRSACTRRRCLYIADRCARVFASGLDMLRLRLAEISGNVSWQQNRSSNVVTMNRQPAGAARDACRHADGTTEAVRLGSSMASRQGSNPGTLGSGFLTLLPLLNSHDIKFVNKIYSATISNIESRGRDERGP